MRHIEFYFGLDFYIFWKFVFVVTQRFEEITQTKLCLKIIIHLVINYVELIYEK